MSCAVACARGYLSDAETNTRSPHVLFVDDEPQMRAAFLRLAKVRGLTAETAATGAEAIALAQSEEYDIVVTDVCMPGMNGAQLLLHLMPILPAAKFVVVTGAELSELTLEPPIEQRLLSVLKKPWNNDQLIDTLVRGQQGSVRQLPSNAPSDERSLEILVIEDNPAHFELLRIGLSKCQETAHRLTRAANLGEARQLLEQGGSYELIVTDLGLPDSQGLETVILLRAAAPEVPIVVLSSRQDDALAMRALRAGAQDVVQKGTLDARAINRALDRKSVV